MKNNQQNHIGIFLHLTQVKAVLLLLFQLLPIIGFLALPLSKLHVVFTVSKSTTYTQKYRHMQNMIWHVWQCVHSEEARGLSIHEYTLVFYFVSVFSLCMLPFAMLCFFF